MLFNYTVVTWLIIKLFLPDTERLVKKHFQKGLAFCVAGPYQAISFRQDINVPKSCFAPFTLSQNKPWIREINVEALLFCSCSFPSVLNLKNFRSLVYFIGSMATYDLSMHVGLTVPKILHAKSCIKLITCVFNTFARSRWSNWTEIGSTERYV